jgi:DNA-directed RNA polymerase subunit K/omega
MTTDFRALCAELTNELHGYASANPHHDSDELVARARAALAKPVPPDDGEVAELVALIREVALVWEPAAPRARQLARAADLLEHLAEPEPVDPTDKELRQVLFDCGYHPGNKYLTTLARAVLARWGRQAPQPVLVPEVPSDEELVQLAFREKLGRLDPNGNIITRYYYPMDIGKNVIAFARAVLARWGQP